MRCENHFFKKGVGYCKQCGTIGCSKCIHDGPDGNTYCTACLEKLFPDSTREKEPRPAPDTAAAPSAAEGDDRVHDRLVIHYRDGRTLCGTSFNMNPAFETFAFIPCGETKESGQIEVPFRDLKCVFKVKEFRRQAPKHEYGKRNFPRGRELIVTFKDGEVIEGYSLQEYNTRSPRFFVIPQNSASNNISVLVERAAVRSIALGDVHRKRVYRPLMDSALKRTLLDCHRRRCGQSDRLSALAERLQRRGDRIRKDLDVFESYGLVRLDPEGDDVTVQWLAPQNPDLEAVIGQEGGRLTGHVGT